MIINSFDYEEVFSKYKEVDVLNKADIFHIYDTGHECMWDNSGFHDSRLFVAVLFNTSTMEKKIVSGRDGINFTDCMVKMVRIFADGSTFIRMSRVCRIKYFQCIEVSGNITND